MKALDTNILIRLLLNDDAKQGESVKKLFLLAEKKGESFFVSSVVMLEMIYVLDSVYSLSRTDIMDALGCLLSMSVLSFEHTNSIQQLITSEKKSSVEIEDLFIGLIGKESGSASTITFDKKAAKSELFELLS